MRPDDSNHASEEIGMFNRLTAIGEDVSLIREKLVEGKPVPELDLRLKRLSADHNKTLTQIGEPSPCFTQNPEESCQK